MKKFISILLSISLMVLIPITIFLFCTSAYLKGSSMKKIINKIDKEAIVEEYGANLLNEEEKASELIDAATKAGLTKELIAISAEKLGNYLQTGKDETLITEEEYQSLIDKYLDDILKETNKENQDINKEEVKSILNEQYIEIKKNIPNISEIEKTESIAFIKPVKTICNPHLRYIFLGITFLIIGMLILLQRKNLSYILYISIPAILSSISIIIIVFLSKIIAKELIKEESESLKNIMETIFIGYGNKMQIAALLLLILSITTIIIRNRIKNQKKTN